MRPLVLVRPLGTLPACLIQNLRIVADAPGDGIWFSLYGPSFCICAVSKSSLPLRDITQLYLKSPIFFFKSIGLCRMLLAYLKIVFLQLLCSFRALNLMA